MFARQDCQRLDKLDTDCLVSISSLSVKVHHHSLVRFRVISGSIRLCTIVIVHMESSKKALVIWFKLQYASSVTSELRLLDRQSLGSTNLLAEFGYHLVMLQNLYWIDLVYEHRSQSSKSSRRLPGWENASYHSTYVPTAHI